MRRAVLALLLLAGCGSRKTTGPRPIELLVPNDAETLDPRHATDAYALRTTRLVHAGLVRLDPRTLEPLPYLAERWTWDDPRTLRVVLRDGLHFHSGAPLRPEDVVASIAAWKSPGVGSRHARVVEAIASVDIAPEPRTVVFRLARSHATLLTDLEIPILRADEAALPPRPDGTLDGLGPYVVAHRDAGVIELVPAKGGVVEAALPVAIRTVHDENARALRMHAGRADLVVNGFSPTLLGSFGPPLVVASRAGANLTYLLPRVDRGPLADVRIRKALALAIDRARLATTLFAGHATPASTLLPEEHWAYTPLPPLPFDPAAAKALLPGPVKLTLLTSTDRLRGTIARAIAQTMADLGIELEVVPLELGTLLARLGAGDFELATLQLPELTEPNVLRTFLHSSAIPPAGANRGRVQDPELDALLDAGDVERDPAERRKIYARLEALVRDRAELIPLWHEDQISVSSARAATFRPSAEGRWLDLATLGSHDRSRDGAPSRR